MRVKARLTPKGFSVLGFPSNDFGGQESYLGASGDLPGWNFGKNLVGKDGKVIAYFGTRVTPGSRELRQAIAKALAAS